MIRRWVLSWAKAYIARHVNAAGVIGPDFVVGDRQLERWWLIPRNPVINLYLHRFNKSDEDRALHDHMYFNLSWILGPDGYNEVLFREPPADGALPATSVRWRRAGSLTPRLPSTAHRVSLVSTEPVWTLFFTGPRVRQWGFWCPSGWRHWREFTDARDSGQVGRGCE